MSKFTHKHTMQIDINTVYTLLTYIDKALWELAVDNNLVENPQLIDVQEIVEQSIQDLKALRESKYAV